MARTRKIHKVRITHPDNEKVWINVKVNDVVTLVGPNGQEMLLDLRQEHAVPKVIDETGDGNSVDNNNPSRLSHMVRVTGENDNFFDAEILDGLSFIGPNGKRGVLLMPGDDAGSDVKDDAGIGIQSSGVTRRVHTVKVEDVSDDEKYIGVCVTDAVILTGPNGDQSVLHIPESDEDHEIDTTEYDGEDEDGDPKPPENDDVNKYIFWPEGSKGPWVKKGEDGRGVTQGILWNIDKAHSGGGRYFLFVSGVCQQGWDGGGSAFGPTLDIVAATSPFGPLDFVHFANPFSPSPVSQETHPADFPGIVTVEIDGTVAYEHSITHEALQSDTLTHWVWGQLDSRDTTGPFVWVCYNDAGFNVNLMEVDDAVTFTVEMGGSGGDQTCTFYMAKQPDTNEDDQDLGPPGSYNLQAGPSANLVAVDAGTYELTLTRTGEDTWEFSSPTVNEPPDNFPGWFIDNDTLFPES